MMKFLLALFLVSLPLPASTVFGGVLLNQSYADQLAAWLGQGDLTLTNIFSQTPIAGGSTLFHTAVDGQGPTFSVIQTNLGLVGGYDPLSWSTNGGYNTDPTDAGRTAFIFNLSNTTELPQLLGNVLGQYQTYNIGIYGPTFGGGHDLTVNSSDLSGGYAYAYSYGGGFGQPNVFGISNSSGQPTSFSVSRVETYTFVTTATPEPATLLLCGAAILILAGFRGRSLARRS